MKSTFLIACFLLLPGCYQERPATYYRITALSNGRAIKSWNHCILTSRGYLTCTFRDSVGKEVFLDGGMIIEEE